MLDVLQYNSKKYRFLYNALSCALIIINAIVFKIDFTRHIGRYQTCCFVLSLLIGEYLKLMLREKMLPKEEIMFKSKRKIYFNITEVFHCVLIFLTVIFIYYTIAILFGAPFFTDVQRTLSFALLLASLTTLPVCIQFGSRTTVEILSNLTTYKTNAITRDLVWNIQFTLVGCWLGAIVMPLDWDRHWQEWPIPNIIGGILGYITSNILNIILLVK